MAAFIYQAIDQNGTQTSGSIEARDRSDALQKLSSTGLQPLDLKTQDDRVSSASPAATAPPDASRLAALKQIRLSSSQLIIFTEELSDLLNAGIQLDPALKLMEGRQDWAAIAKLTGQIRAAIRDGHSFSRALQKTSPSFDPLYINLVSAGEASGSLPQLLNRHTHYLIKVQELKNKLLTALIYPAFLLIAGVAVTVLFITFLIPRLTVLIEATGSSLPKGVQLIAAGSQWLSAWWWALLIGLVMFFSIFRMIISIPVNRPRWDRAKLQFPLIGKLLRARFEVHFLRTLSNLLANGLALVDGLKLSQGITANQYLQSEIVDITAEIVDGSSLHAAMRRHACFPGSLADYIRISEQTGQLDSGMNRAAERAERGLEKNIERFSAMVQPVIIVVMAAVIGLMAYTMISVIYDTIEILRA